MAIITPISLAPGALPRIRGRVYARTTMWGVVAQAWPRKRGKPRSWTTHWQSQQFGLAARMAANSEPIQYQTAIEMTKGTGWVPRDILVRAALGLAYEVYQPDGTLCGVNDHGAPAEPAEW